MFLPSVKFDASFALGGGVGFVVGAFTPAAGRAIKAGFVALAKKIVAAAESSVSSAASSVASEVKKA